MKMNLYFFNKHTALGWEHEYNHYECDADAMMAARNRLASEEINMIAVYRHESEDTAGIKHFVVAYDK